jgi:hypothetical protein
MAKPWTVSLGFVDIGSNGVEVKPQFKLGVASRNAHAGAGIGDVRDGLSLDASAGVAVHGSARGRNFRQLVNNLKMESGTRATHAARASDAIPGVYAR